MKNGALDSVAYVGEPEPVIVLHCRHTAQRPLR